MFQSYDIIIRPNSDEAIDIHIVDTEFEVVMLDPPGTIRTSILQGLIWAYEENGLPVIPELLRFAQYEISRPTCLMDNVSEAIQEALDSGCADKYKDELQRYLILL